MGRSLALGGVRRSWEQWSLSADKAQDGWQSEFPSWGDLMAAAIRAMSQSHPSPELIEDVAFCWAISEEGETLADCSRLHVQVCWNMLVHLAGSAYAATRWQVYDVLSGAGPRAEDLLRQGLDDHDAYCRRRALISLARLKPADAQLLAERFLQDPDPYMRQASIDMVRVTKAPDFADKARQQLLNDPVWHVRKAAHELDAM